MIVTSYDQLSPIEQKLVDEAARVMENAYCPYSHFHVGAAVLTTGGHMIGGANVENAAYPAAICGERAAIFRANAEGYRSFEKIAIITRLENSDSDEPSWSCGACRQVINEFSQLSGIDIEVITSNTRKTIIWKDTISSLIPGAFGPADLGIDIEFYRK